MPSQQPFEGHILAGRAPLVGGAGGSVVQNPNPNQQLPGGHGSKGLPTQGSGTHTASRIRPAQARKFFNGLNEQAIVDAYEMFHGVHGLIASPVSAPYTLPT